jgi:hypothetical protein
MARDIGAMTAFQLFDCVPGIAYKLVNGVYGVHWTIFAVRKVDVLRVNEI